MQDLQRCWRSHRNKAIKCLLPNYRLRSMERLTEKRNHRLLPVLPYDLDEKCSHSAVRLCPERRYQFR